MLGCAAKANASDPIDYSALKLKPVEQGQIEVVFVTGQAYNPGSAQASLQYILSKVCCFRFQLYLLQLVF